ncbi:MAG TPA: hypothetical protein VHF23_08180 [Gaiellaceae bacterium]|nr:hypothetical protein [Gaiellaceae bacterium]
MFPTFVRFQAVPPESTASRCRSRPTGTGRSCACAHLRLPSEALEIHGDGRERHLGRLAHAVVKAYEADGYSLRSTDVVEVDPLA